jgi:hypothetical protein
MGLRPFFWFILTSFVGVVGLSSVAIGVERGMLLEVCDSSVVTHYFYGNGKSEDITYIRQYHKRLRRDIFESPVKTKDGNRLLRDFRESSRLGLSVRCEKVPQFTI